MEPTDLHLDVPPILTPDKDGTYTCDICHTKVRVGYGGLKNFMQHRGSPGCLRAAKKGELKPQESQTGNRTNTLHSYFTKTLTPTTRDGPNGGPNQVQGGKQNGLTSEAPSEVTSASTATLSVSANQSSAPPTSPLVSSFLMSGLPHEPRVGSVSADSVTSKSAHPDAHALSLLNSVTCAAQELPSHILEAEEGDDIARVVLAGGPKESSEAWEHLDCMLNWLLGYGIDVEDVAQRVRRGPFGIGGLVQYINGFVINHGVTGDLLEGKIGRLLKAIELAKQRGRTIDPALPDVSPIEDNCSPRELTHIIVDDDDDDDIEYIGGLPLSTKIGPALQPINSSSSPSTILAGAPVDNVTERHGRSQRARCKQHIVSAPPGKTGIGAYPFLLHIEEHMPWEFSSLGGTLLLRARKCENRGLDEHGLCKPCRALLSNIKFRKILARVEEGVNEYTPFKYHGLLSLAEIARKKERTIDLFRLRRTNDARKLIGREGAITMHRQVLLAMSSRKIPRLDQCLNKAGRGIYHPKGFSEEEDLQALLFLRLGGQRVAEIAHRMFGIPTPSTVRRRTMIPPLICSSSYPILRDLESNLKAAFDDAELLFQDMERGDVHLAHEATIGAIGILCSNSRLYSAKPFLVSGSCKKETAEDHASLIQTTLNAIKDTKALSDARVVSIASDGEAKRGKALVQLTFKRWLSPSSPIYPWLSGCAFLDLHVGADDITCDKDWKHVAAKRPRNALLREKGLLVHGTWITPMLIQSHLLEAGHKHQHVRAVLNPNDKQDVLLAFTLLQDIWNLPQLTSGAPGRIKARESLRIFGSMCYHFLMPYICVDLSIEDQLEYLSYAAHLALVLYVHDNACSNFIPTALYIDLMIMVKNVFFCVAKAKIDTPNNDFNIILLGTDRLENLFGCLRTIVGNDANVDNYQLGSRLTGTMESMNILALHPEWDKAPRRLHLPCVSRDSSTIPDSADHISPRSWRASQALSSVTPPTVWIRGRRKLEADYLFVCDILRAVGATPNATVLAPFGTLLVHASAPPSDEMEDSELSHDDQDDDVLHGLVPGAVTSDHTDVPVTGDGVRELEDAATSLDWDPEQHAFSNVVVFGDSTNTLKKSRALSLFFKYSNSTSSTDRLRRVQQQARYVQSEPETLVDDSSEELSDILMVDNPWRNFQTYSLERRGDRNVPTQFLGAARWREYRGETGYFVDFASGPTRYRPVEFNFDNLCWVEITWNPVDNRYDAVRPAGRNYNCDIDARNLPTREEWGRIDGQPEEEPSTSEPRTPTPSETSGDDEETNDDEESEVGEIIQTAESLRINEPESIEVRPPADMATATITQEDLALEEARRITEEAESYLRPINPTTGHRMTADDAAIFRAVGPDVPDPPPGAGGPPPPRRRGGPFGQGPPGNGGPPHRGRQPQFGGGGGGDPFGGGPPPPLPPAAGPALGAPHASDKLVGETPTIFDGNRDEYESFLTQWHIYWGQNSEAPIMTNVYRRCLLFLGFIKGPRVSNWTLGFLQWLNNELHQGRSRYDPYLWDTLTAGFSDRFSNVLEQEQAQATLAKGFKMIGDDIDSYVTNFEQLARKADYRLNDRQTLDRFTAGLPRALFTKIYELDDPHVAQQCTQCTGRPLPE
ncbi:hypothetical protein EDB92DRAFT_1995091 [Lactarius akahatsu]|uniref:Retrotransposon gag domain-containing protein n=1 Tax=Lactarius akahatsu TaxID=416441 RepID=A0AAD4LFE0_9AGAM|nr:hypothetical protein EDB92DRAFT_1995091 [Lactarius akahatsu]